MIGWWWKMQFKWMIGGYPYFRKPPYGNIWHKSGRKKQLKWIMGEFHPTNTKYPPYRTPKWMIRCNTESGFELEEIEAQYFPRQGLIMKVSTGWFAAANCELLGGSSFQQVMFFSAIVPDSPHHWTGIPSHKQQTASRNKKIRSESYGGFLE